MKGVTLADYTKAFIIRRYTSIEAGYVNDPADLGGETNHGITKRVAEKHKSVLVSRFGWNGRMQDLTTEMAFYIYDVDYWAKVSGDALYKVHPLLADKMFDIAINAGVGRAGSFLQEILNVNNNQQKLYKDLKVDGSIGSVSIDTLHKFMDIRKIKGVKILLHSLIALQTHHYINISLGRELNERFTYGWLVRAYDSAEEYDRLGFLYYS